MSKQPELKFPKRFLWGAATAAHQVEGGTHNQWTVSELEHAKTRAAQAEYQYGDLENWSAIAARAKHPGNYVSAGLADHYTQYKRDFAMLDTLHMNAYRFSIEWSRIEPEEGSWDAAALDHYKAYIAELKRRDIEPVMTLFHFTVPVWFAEMGAFEKRRNVKCFVRFVDKVMQELGTQVKYVITLNEPEVYAFESYHEGNWPPHLRSRYKFWRVINNLAAAHRQSAKLIHSMSRRYKVSIAKHSVYIYPGDDAWITRASAAVMQYFQDDYFLKKVIKSCDFIGMNYYLSCRVYGYRIHNPDKRLSDLGWDMNPSDIQYALERVYRRYKKPIIITENGLADADDEYRKWWLMQTLIGMQRARDEGVQLEGYLHWSLIDNFEWQVGKWPRFGLAAVNYATKERTLRPSALWFGAVIKKLRGV